MFLTLGTVKICVRIYFKKLLQRRGQFAFLCIYINKQTYQIWTKSNSRKFHKAPLHSYKVTVWYAMSQFGVIGPYFFEEENWTITVTFTRDVFMLETYLHHRLEKMVEEHDLGDIWFQQDGAVA